MRRGIIFGGLIASATALSAGDIQETNSPSLIWERDIGGGFKENTFQVGLSAGRGWGAHIFGSEAIHDVALAYLNAGWIFTDVELPDTWLRGNWELRGEIFGGEQLRPERYIVGITFPTFRYHLATGTRVVPFVQLGAGGTVTDIKGPDLSTTLEFNLHMGAGVNYFITERVAFSLEYRLFHLSNARIETPNHGVNSHLVLAGLSYWF
ncbi:MAG TPA: acyloxyacyl hydrolase [Candidatus Limnocylindria bacterium]|nr:acyloxyacyl hydrolase [Candidatus Limnocylindria bacterium]